MFARSTHSLQRLSLLKIALIPLLLFGQQKIIPVVNLSVPPVNQYDDVVSFPVVIDSLFYFFHESDSGPRLYRSNGTTDGTHLLTELGYLTVRNGFAAGDRYVYITYDSDQGTQLYAVSSPDPTPQFLTQLAPAEALSTFFRVVATDAGQAFLAPELGAAPFAIIQTDGTAAGTRTFALPPPGESQRVTVRDIARLSAEALLLSIQELDISTQIYTNYLLRLNTTSATLDTLDTFPDAFTASEFRVIGNTIFVLNSQRDQTATLTGIGTDGSSTTQSFPYFYGYADPELSVYADKLYLLGAEASGNPVRLFRFDPVTEELTPVSPANIAVDGLLIQPASAVPGIYLVGRNSTNGSELVLLRPDQEPLSLATFPTLDPATLRLSWYAASGGVFFSAMSTTSGLEPFFTDGTPTGTGPLLDIAPGSQGSFPENYRQAGTTVFFGATNLQNGLELYGADPDGENARLIKDLNTLSPVGSAPFNFLVFGDELLFRAAGSSDNSEWWRSDGRALGTNKIAELNADNRSTNIRPLGASPVAEEEFLFLGLPQFGDFALYRTDGTAAGTRPLARAGTSPANERIPMDGFLLFEGWIEVNGDQVYGLHRTDGTADGTSLVRSFDYPIEQFTKAGDQLYFSALNQKELWRSDGTAAGTQLVYTFSAPGSSPTPVELTALDDRVVFRGFDVEHGYEVWVSDGTSGGTFALTEYEDYRVDLSNFVAVGNSVFYQASPGLSTALYRTNGSAEGTIEIRNFPGARSDVTRYAAAFQERYYFGMATEEHGEELWVSDGTESGTTLLIETVPGPEGERPYQFRATGNLLYFLTNRPDTTFVWRTDGTTAGSFAVFDSEVVAESVIHADQLYFSAQTPDYGQELFVTDGSAATLVDDYVPGPGSSAPRELAAAGQAGLFFLATSPVIGTELHTLAGCSVSSDYAPVYADCGSYAWLSAPERAGERNLSISGAVDPIEIRYLAEGIQLIGPPGAQFSATLELASNSACGDQSFTYPIRLPDLSACVTATADPPEAPLPTLLLFPNPVRDRLTLVLDSDNPEAVAELYDPTGRLLLRKAIPSRSLDLSLEAYPAGLYFVSIMFPRGRISRTIVKQ
jgi:ELWxxDGT repeat protein